MGTLALAAALGFFGSGLWSATVAGRPEATGAGAPFTLQLRLKNAMAVAAVVESGRDAATRLARPECGRLFTELRDARGLPLQRRLDALGRSSVEHLQSIYFYDGSSRRGCLARRALAVTEPGSVVVHVCPEFVLRQRQDPDQAPVALIHELLHTLGLGENPPSSEAITRQVRARCGR